jgi:hypothetical protein
MKPRIGRLRTDGVCAEQHDTVVTTGHQKNQPSTTLPAGRVLIRDLRCRRLRIAIFDVGNREGMVSVHTSRIYPYPFGYTTRKLTKQLGPWTYLDKRRWHVSYDDVTHDVAVLDETTDRWCHVQIGEKGHRLWEVHRDKSYEDDHPQDAVQPVMETCTGRPASITVLDKDEIPNISSTFMCDRIGRLGDWDLLKNVYEYIGAPPLYECMMKEERLILVSDGGAKGESGSSGWVLGIR